MVCCLATAGVDLVLSGRLTMFFDLVFITACLGLASRVRADAMFVACFAPPAVMVLAFAIIAVVDPGVVGQPDDGLLQSVIAGLTDHAAALAVGYALCLGALGVRQRDRLRPRTG